MMRTTFGRSAGDGTCDCAWGPTPASHAAATARPATVSIRRRVSACMAFSSTARSTATETELLAERAIAEFDRDLSPLDAPLAALLDIAVGVTGDAENRRPHITFLHHRRDVAGAGGRAGAGDRDLRVADQMPHDRGRLAVRRGLVAETLVIPASLRNQRLPAFDDGRPAGGHGDLSIGREQIRVLLGSARVMDDAISIHEFADQRSIGNRLQRIGCHEGG